MVSAESIWGTMLFGGKLQVDAKNSNFEFFESSLYMISGSTPLIYSSSDLDLKCASGTKINLNMSRVVMNEKGGKAM